MFDIPALTAFFGWCSVINIGLLFLTSLLLLGLKGFILGVHGKLTGIPDEDLNVLYINYLGHYKIAIIVLNIVPYCALRLMA